MFEQIEIEIEITEERKHHKGLSYLIILKKKQREQKKVIDEQKHKIIELAEEGLESRGDLIDQQVINDELKEKIDDLENKNKIKTRYY